ncbi:MAG: amidohydrolase [Promethearchaeota archaeon]
MVDTAIYNVTAVTMDSKLRVLKNVTILIEGQEICEIGSDIDIPQGTERISGEGKVVMPGLINCHNHAAMSLFRGYSDDVPLDEWLNNYIFPLEAKLVAEDVYIGAKLAAAEMLLSGTTCCFSGYFHADSEAQAFKDMGMRAVIGAPIFSWDTEKFLKEAKDFIKQYHDTANSRIRTAIFPHSPYLVGPNDFQSVQQTVLELNEAMTVPVPVQTHVAETKDEKQKLHAQLRKWKEEDLSIKSNWLKMDIVELLDAVGFLSTPNLLFGHCVHVTTRDMELMRTHNVPVVSVPTSNLKLASGIAPINDFLAKGIQIVLGTDGAASNNCLDLFDTIKLVALLHKGKNLDPKIIPASKALQMATCDGAQAIGWKKLGVLKPGYRADLIMLDFRKPHLTPCYSEISHLVYAANGSDVDFVMIDGQILVENRTLKHIDLETLLDDVEIHRKQLFEKIG